MVDASTLQSVVKGFLIPCYTDERTGTHTFDDPEAFEKVRQGYACASCLAEFHHYMPVCPLCGNERDVAQDLRETPKMWQEHYDEANSPGERTETVPMHETIQQLLASKEVEQIPLKGLRPSKRGRGRPR
jgi:hypothetical protein